MPMNRSFVIPLVNTVIFLLYINSATDKFTLRHWLSGRGFANGPGDRGSISGRVKLKTQKAVLDTFLFNTHQYKVCFKGKVE